jgi:hypothetical protein
VASDDDEPDVRLRVFIWGYISVDEPRVEYFPPTDWDAAIGRALDLSKAKDEKISRIQVVDGWSMLIAQFTHRRVIMGERAFDGG